MNETSSSPIAPLADVASTLQCCAPPVSSKEPCVQGHAFKLLLEPRHSLCVFLIWLSLLPTNELPVKPGLPVVISTWFEVRGTSLGSSTSARPTELVSCTRTHLAMLLAQGIGINTHRAANIGQRTNTPPLAHRVTPTQDVNITQHRSRPRPWGVLFR